LQCLNQCDNKTHALFFSCSLPAHNAMRQEKNSPTHLSTQAMKHQTSPSE
jgi:hypothetical protein